MTQSVEQQTGRPPPSGHPRSVLPLGYTLRDREAMDEFAASIRAVGAGFGLTPLSPGGRESVGKGMSWNNAIPICPCHDLSASRAQSSTRLADKSWHNNSNRRELPLIRPRRPPSRSRGEGKTIQRNDTQHQGCVASCFTNSGEIAPSYSRTSFNLPFRTSCSPPPMRSGLFVVRLKSRGSNFAD